MKMLRRLKPMPFIAPPPPKVRPTALVVVEFLGGAHPYGLDPVLLPTDRLLSRWAVSQGSDEYLHGWNEVPERSRPPPLDDDTAIIVDQVVMHSPVQTREFAKRWYFRPNEPLSGLAKALGLHRDTVQMRWRSTLWALRREFLKVALDV